MPPVSTSSPPSCSVAASASAFARTCALVLAERLRGRDPEARRLRGDHVAQRAALHAREDRAVERLRVLLPAEDEARARPGERLVRRRGDEVAVRDRVRVQPGRDEPGEVRHVAEEAARRPRRRSRGSAQVSTVRGYAEPPQTISFGRCSFASASTSS